MEHGVPDTDTDRSWACEAVFVFGAAGAKLKSKHRCSRVEKCFQEQENVLHLYGSWSVKVVTTSIHLQMLLIKFKPFLNKLEWTNSAFKLTYDIYFENKPFIFI